MKKLEENAKGGTMALSDILSDWELGIGALQSKIIRRVIKQHNEKKEAQGNSKNEKSNCDDNNEDKKDPEKEDQGGANNDDSNKDTEQKEDK